MTETEKDIIQEAIVKPIPKQDPEVGIATNNNLSNNILDAAIVGGLDLNSVNSLIQSAQNREQAYELIDAMSQDDVIAAALETYTEDTIQTNDKGQVIWAESDKGDVLDYVTWLVDSLNIDKHIYQWAYCLIAYGDVYLRLFRNSDVEEDILFAPNKKKSSILNESKEEPLNEDIKLRVYNENDRYVTYVQMVDNPGEMFDLQRFGKNQGYIKAPVRVIQQPTSDALASYLTRYNMKQSDVEVYDGNSFVHGCLENTNQRQPEMVQIFLDSYREDKRKANGESDDEINNTPDSMTTSYQVKRGQSILFNVFRVWRELNLLELSALLNRLTKSSLVRVLSVDIGDMPKEQVQSFLQRLKEKIEQKSGINTGKSMQDYTAAGPIDNTIYVPTHGGQGNITTTTIGGDYDPKTLVDIEYFRDKLFGGLKIPKQFFGQTGDSTGFNGGSSLTITSSRYGKTIKRLQGVLCQLVTDIVNLFLIDRGLFNYVNKFQIRMQTPVTQEEIDKRTNTDNRVKYVGDLMQQLDMVKDDVTKLKIYKSLLSNVINDSEVVTYLDDYIETLENPKKPKKEGEEVELVTGEDDQSAEVKEGVTFENISQDVLTEESGSKEEDSYLPTPDELGISLLEKP